MGNIRNLSIISSGDAILGDPMTNNFSQVVAALNNQALNSDNYGQSSIKSQHVQSNAVLSQHLRTGGFGVAKFSSNVLVHNNFNFQQTASGVRFVNISAISSNMPANGVRLGIYTLVTNNPTAATYTTADLRFTVNWSDAIHGNPGFTTTPHLVGEPAFIVHSTSGSGPHGVTPYSAGSQSAVIYAKFNLSDKQTYTVHFMAIGPV